MTRLAVVSASILALLSVPTPCAANPIGLGAVAAAADPGTGTLYTAWGAPTITPKTPLVIKTTIMVNGKPVTKQVEVTGIQAWKDTDRGKLTIDEWYAVRVKAMSDASKAKAELIVKATNKAFEKEFALLGEEAKLEDPIKRKLRAYHNKETEVYVTSLPGVRPPDPKNVDPKTKQPFYVREDAPMWLVKDPAGETGNGGTFSPKSPGGLGFRGIMGPADLNVATSATGIDAYGFPSVVSFGIENTYVAEVEPTYGMTDEAILLALGALLNAHGIPVTYDSLLKELSMDNPLLDGQTFAWGSTDPTLDFFIGLDGVTAGQVPEPASLALLGTGLLTLARLSRRRQRTTGDLDQP